MRSSYFYIFSIFLNILVGSEKGQNNSSEDEIENIRSEKAQNISLDEEKMADQSNETGKEHNAECSPHYLNLSQHLCFSVAVAT